MCLNSPGRQCRLKNDSCTMCHNYFWCGNTDSRRHRHQIECCREFLVKPHLKQTIVEETIIFDMDNFLLYVVYMR